MGKEAPITLAEINEHNRLFWEANPEKHLEQFVRHLRDVAKESLSSTALTPGDAFVLKKGRDDLGGHVESLSTLLRRLDPHASSFGFQCLCSALADAFLIGSRGVITDSAKSHFETIIIEEQKHKKPADMRDAKAKANAPKEIALISAIEAERGAGHSVRASKEAGAILAAVNKRLTEAGHPAVKLDVIRRRLEKFQRS